MTEFFKNTPEAAFFKEAVLRIGNCVIITTDNSGNILDFNRCAENIFGYSGSSVFGKSFTSTFLSKKDDPSELPFSHFLKRVQDSIESEWTVYTEKGEEIQLIFSVEAIGDRMGYLFSGLDVSEQRRIENAFEGIELFNERILNTSPTILYIFDFQEQRIIFSNRDFYAMFGYSEANLPDLHEMAPVKLLHPDDFEKRTIHRKLLTESSDGDILEVEYRIKHADGTWRWIQNRDTVFQRDENGIPKLILGSILDISESKFAREALNIAIEKLSDTNKLLTDANNLKTELLGIAAHDLKNPLSIIKNLSTILEGNPQDEVAELSSVIRQASQQMLDLINELLESSAIESGRYPIHIEKINLSVLLQYVLEGNKTSAQKKGQHLEIAQKEDCIIMADGSSLRRVMDNLISNAIKYSPLNTIITIRLFKKGNTARFEVSDQGPGLSEDDKQKIFGKFQRLHAQPTGGESSSGLGLSIVKQIIELHNGRVWAESRGESKGTTFIVELPETFTSSVS